MQDDVLFEYMTVKEALTFAARMKLSNLHVREQDLKVAKVIQ